MSDTSTGVPDPTSQAASPSFLQRWTMPGRRWLTALVVLLILVGGFFLVRYLGGLASRNTVADASIEDNWNRTIRNLGVAPIFPPEEDLVVGDVLAVVVRDVDIDSHVQTNTVSGRSFVTRSVKLAHVDVSPALDAAYLNLPVFPATVLPVPPLRSGVARAFSDAVLLGNLPRAAFPRLKIQGVTNAAAGLTLDGAGAANFGAGSRQVEEFELSDVRTYGLPSVTALQLFEAFCAKPETAEVCKEATARKHLERVVGDHISKRFVDDKSGDYRYALEVEIVMVYRVYLTGSIVDLRRTAENQKGGLLALWPFGSSQATPPATPAPAPYSAPAAAPYGAPPSQYGAPPAAPYGGSAAAPTGAAPAPANTASSDQLQAINSRLAEVEQKLAGVKNGAALNYQSFFGNESSLEGKFERPVAIGYRSVKHDFSTDKPSVANTPAAPVQPSPTDQPSPK